MQTKLIIGLQQIIQETEFIIGLLFQHLQIRVLTMVNFLIATNLTKLELFLTHLFFFFQEEDFTNWNLKVKVNNAIFEKQFISDKETVFSESEKNLFSMCFDKNFIDLQAFLQAGKGADFLNFVGIPYMEMNDQDILPTQMFGDKYSLLADELTD